MVLTITLRLRICIPGRVGRRFDTWMTPFLRNEPGFRSEDESCARVDRLELHPSHYSH